MVDHMCRTHVLREASGLWSGSCGDRDRQLEVMPCELARNRAHAATTVDGEHACTPSLATIDSHAVAQFSGIAAACTQSKDFSSQRGVRQQSVVRHSNLGRRYCPDNRSHPQACSDERPDRLESRHQRRRIP